MVQALWLRTIFAQQAAGEARVRIHVTAAMTLALANRLAEARISQNEWLNVAELATSFLVGSRRAEGGLNSIELSIRDGADVRAGRHPAVGDAEPPGAAGPAEAAWLPGEGQPGAGVGDAEPPGAAGPAGAAWPPGEGQPGAGGMQPRSARNSVHRCAWCQETFGKRTDRYNHMRRSGPRRCPQHPNGALLAAISPLDTRETRGTGSQTRGTGPLASSYRDIVSGLRQIPIGAPQVPDHRQPPPQITVSRAEG